MQGSSQLFLETFANIAATQRAKFHLSSTISGRVSLFGYMLFILQLIHTAGFGRFSLIEYMLFLLRLTHTGSVHKLKNKYQSQ